jgi:DNA replication protein DnaC
MTNGKKEIIVDGDTPAEPERDVCPECLGTGVVVEPSPVGGAGYARPCICTRGVIEGDPLTAAGIPDHYRNCTLESFKIVKNADSSLVNAKRVAEEFALLYPNVDIGLLFSGPPGVGKTHLAAGIASRLIKTGKARCLFVDFSDVLLALKNSFNNPEISEESLLRPLRVARVLFIDDLGSMKISDWALDMLSNVINSRYKYGRVLVATTNFPDETFSIKNQTLEDRIGHRLRSRLFEMCKTVRMAGEDFRKPMQDRPIEKGF